MKIKLMIAVLFLNSGLLYSQSNWIVDNFKSYLTNNSYSSYISRANNVMTNLTGTNEKVAFQVINLFKALSGEGDNQMPICYFLIAQNALNLTYSATLIKPNLYLYIFNVGGMYYYCLYNTDVKKARGIKLYSSAQTSSGGLFYSSFGGGAYSYSFSCIYRSPNLLYDFSITEFKEFPYYGSNPCLK